MSDALRIFPAFPQVDTHQQHRWASHFTELLREHKLPDVVEEKSREKLLECAVSLPTGHNGIRAWGFKNYIFVGDDRGIHPWPLSPEKVEEPFVKVEPTGPAFQRTVQIERRTNGYPYRTEKVSMLDSYGGRWNGNREEGEIPWNYLPCRATAGEVTADLTLRFPRPNQGTCDLFALGQDSTIVKCSTDFFGLKLDWSVNLRGNPDGYGDNEWTLTRNLLKNFDILQGKEVLWRRFLDTQRYRETMTKGLKATASKKGIRENLDRLKTEDPITYSFFVWLHDEKTRNGTSNNTLLSAFLEARGGSFNDLREGLLLAMQTALDVEPSFNWKERTTETRAYALALPGAGDKNDERRAKREWNLRKGAKEQAIGLGVDADRHPKLLAAIEALEIPLSLFHEPGDALALVNVEFDLWEAALKREGWKEVLCEIAQSASRRAQYEKNVTPYLAFLFRIEKYLDRHSGKGKKWRSMPKFVKSEYELEMTEAEEEGTTKKRSALTPVPDNETRVLTVPYVSMAVHGVQTTYCYSLNYQVFEEHTLDVESLTPITHELEVKLNGRDDYGLMYYTLTGSARNTGYPAFLIIFERRKAGTHVHFHRVHPCRSKDGKKTPASRLIQECYRYMAGNVRAEEIAAQQGDLIFIPANEETDFTEAQGVLEFESHAFSSSDGTRVSLLPREVKSIKNRLGFIKATGDLLVNHPEHEPVKLPAGIYEVRRCKSWEANPKAVWVLTID